MQIQQPLNIFIVYAREDADALHELQTQFIPIARSEILHVWYDGKILPGQHWDTEIKTHLQNADIILLLISKHFFASEYIQATELREALARHEAGKSVVVPVIVRPCIWQEAFGVSRIQALPVGAQPIYSSAWNDPEEAMVNVVEGVKKVAEKLRADQPKQDSQIQDLIEQKEMGAVPEVGQGQKFTNWKVKAVAIVGILVVLLFGSLFFNEPVKDQKINGKKDPTNILEPSMQTPETRNARWQEKVVQIISDKSKGSGFFINSNGYVLTMFGTGFEETGKYFILDSNGKRYDAQVIAHSQYKGFEFVVFGIPANNTPYINILPLKRPEKNMSIEILGVEGKNTNWMRYTARVTSVDQGRVYYNRPEEGWIGMMGAPIIEVSDEVVLGVHMGKSTNDSDIKMAQGILFEQSLLDALWGKN